ncbi:MAG: pseudouridine synthase, partial [Bacteroidia bacterium]
MYRYFIIHKPYGMLSQFTKEGNHATLADLFDFPKDVYPVGRLDSDSEGLLIITNDKNLNFKLLSPKFKHYRTYLAQV